MQVSKTKIKFDMDIGLPDEISNHLLLIGKQFHTVHITNTCGSKRFRIPSALQQQLDLQPGQAFTLTQYEYDSEYHLTFNVNPTHFKQQNKTNKNKCKNFLRRLALAGSSGALFACIPTQIVKEIPNLEYVALVHPETYPNNEWLLKFHTTDSI